MAALPDARRSLGAFIDRSTRGMDPEASLLLRRARGFGLVALVVSILGGGVQIVLASTPGAHVIAPLTSMAAALALVVLARDDGRRARAIAHATIGMFAVAIMYSAWSIGGASPVGVTYGSLLVLGSCHVLGIRAAAGWTAVCIAAVGALVAAATLPPPAPDAFAQGKPALFASRAVVLAATCALAGLGRRFEDRQREQLLFLAGHDPLTGLLNRRAFAERLAQGIARCDRYGHALALLYVDLDAFKRVNDACGHLAGDRVLERVGERIASITRASDAAGRLGGDEFVVVLESIAEAKSARLYAERLLALVGEPIDVAERRLEIAASLGIAIYPADAADEVALMRRADAAMYEAKRRGGARVLRAGEPDAAARS